MPQPASLDLAAVRSRFPMLADGFVYLDNAGGSAVLADVARRTADYMLTTSVQVGASYAPSALATERFAEAHRRLAQFVNAPRGEEIVFGPSTTGLIGGLARAMRRQLRPGDEIVVTETDHESNIGPWRTLEREGVVLRQWRCDPDTLELTLDGLDAAMSERTRLVAVTHASNVLGTLTPVAEIAAHVHARGARIMVDGVGYAPHRAIDVQASNVDYYVFSFYKAFGPHFAMLWGRHEHLVELDGLYHRFYGPEAVPMKLEAGSASYELAWGAMAILDYLEELGGAPGRPGLEAAFEAIAEQEEAVGARLLDWLGSRNDIRVVGRREADRDRRVPIISFKPEGREAGEVVRAVDQDGIGLRHGDFHSRDLLERAGLTGMGGVIRASMVHYNTVEEIDRTIRSLEGALHRA